MPAMQLLALKTSHIITSGENLQAIIEQTLEENTQSLNEGDILVIAETLVATTQNRLFSIEEIPLNAVSGEAKTFAKKYKLNARLVQKILEEADHVFGGLPGLLLTEKEGVLIANSGVDKSNSGGKNTYSLWPKHPYTSARLIMKKLKEVYEIDNLGVIISDSRVLPMRKGVNGVAIGVAGFSPVIDCRGKKDLFGHLLVHTQRAIADQLADAAHVVMGEADEQTPFVLIKNAPVEFTDRKIDPQETLMPRDQDLFLQIFKNYEDRLG